MRTIKIQLTYTTDSKEDEAELVAECEALAEDFGAECEVDINQEE